MELQQRKRVARRKRLNKRHRIDRLSALPDEMLHHIMSFLDISEAVQTSLLSKRWLNLWTTLPYIRFEDFHCDPGTFYFFFYRILEKRNIDSPTSTFIIDLSEADEYINYDSIDYATSHRVKHLELTKAVVDWSFYVKGLKVLHLTECKFPLMDWTLPHLETLCLRDVEFPTDEGRLRFDKFENLKKLTLMGCSQLYFDGMVFLISSPTLESLEIGVGIREEPRTRNFVISAPKLKSLTFHATYIPVLSVEDGFPCLETLKVDINDFNMLEEKNQAAKKIIGLLHQFPTTKYLKLSFHTVKVLVLGPDISEHKASQFGSLKSVSLTAHSLIGNKPGESEHQTNSINCLIHYFLKTSPSAKIFFT